MRVGCALAAALAGSLAATGAAQGTKNGTGVGYQYWCLGSCDKYADVKPSAGGVLMGGSTDVDDAFLWQIANAAGGDFLVLRASGTPAYNPYVWALADGSLHSVTTVLLTSAAGGSAQFVLDAVAAADAIFFAGGDQTLYVEYITGTPLEAALTARAAEVTVGGTSAGCDYAGGGWVFSPPSDAPAVTSADALADPYTPAMLFAPGPVALAGYGGPAGAAAVLADTHFEQRDRMGRVLAFGARLAQDGSVPVGGAGGACVTLVAVNEKSAVLLYPNGTGAVVGGGSSSLNGRAFVCRMCAPPGVCAPGKPLTAGPFQCERLVARDGDVYDFRAWEGTGARYSLSVKGGKLAGDPYGPA